MGLEVGLLKLDLKEEVKFLVLLRTHTVVREPKAAKRSSMEVWSQVSLSGLRSFGISHIECRNAKRDPCSGVKSVHPHDPACKAESAPREEDSQAAPGRALPGFTPNQRALLFRKSETAGKRRQECPKKFIGAKVPRQG